MNDTTPRQRVWQAIRHQQPDRVPWQVNCTVPMRQKLESYFGTSDLDDVLGNHVARYRARGPDSIREIRPGFFRDEFGVVWNRTVDKDIGVVEHYQLPTRSLADYQFPDPRDPQRYAPLPAFVATHRDPGSFFRFLRLAANEGEMPATQSVPLECWRARAGADVARILALETGAPITIIRRLLKLGDEAVVFDEIYLSSELFPDLSIEVLRSGASQSVTV